MVRITPLAVTMSVASIPYHLTWAALSEMLLTSVCKSLDNSARGPTTKAFTIPYSLSLLAMGPSRGLLRSCPLYQYFPSLNTCH